MVTWRDTSDHDPGDENDWRYCYVHDGNCEEQCPFCGELMCFSTAWCVPVPRPDRFEYPEFDATHPAKLDPSYKIYDETLTCCDRGACRDKAKKLANRLGIPAYERVQRREFDLYMKERS